MKQKANLKKKIVPSLLTVSILCALYSTDALAVSINGKNQTDLNLTQNGAGQYIIDYDALENNAKSHKFVIAQGDKVIITKHRNAGSLISEIKKAKGDLTKIRDALAKYSVVGVVGGEGQLDVGLTGVLDALNNEDLQEVLHWGGIDVNSITGITNKIIAIDTANNNHAVYNEGTDITIGDENNSTVAIGVVSGDLSFNTGLVPKGTILPNFASDKGEPTSIERSGDAVLNINNGNVFGGIGGSAAISVGNIEASFDPGDSASSNPDAQGIFSLNGETYVTLKGDVKTTIGTNANAAGIFNGGMAMAVGGIAESTIVGSTNLAVKSSVELDTAINGLTVGLSGGGAALTTIGGTAISTVKGSTNIDITDGFSAGIIGGGTAGAFDATGGVEAIAGPLNNLGIFSHIGDEIGHDDGTADTTIKSLINVKVDNAIEGGKATAKTGNTNIDLNGNTTALGVVGSGMAIASHTYTWKNDGTNTDEQHEKYDSYGSSIAVSETGKSIINVNLNGQSDNLWQSAMALAEAVSSGKTTDEIVNSLDGFKEAGAVIGLTGGGVAIAHGSPSSNFDRSGKNGSFATVTTAGSEINLNSGYATGVFGGSLALTDNNAYAKASMTDTIDINVNDDMKVVGLFGNGLAYFTGSSQGGTKGLTGLAEVSAQDININVAGGTVDGIVGGGLAIDDSQANTTNAKVTSNNVTVNVSGGEVNVLQFDPLVSAAAAVDRITGNTADDPNWSKYVSAVKAAAENIAIAAGGVAVGGGAQAEVAEAEINISGGTVKNDIIAGGISVYGYADSKDQVSHVGKSTINLDGGVVEGNIYAGGVSVNTPNAKGYDKAEAVVDTAIINWNGTDIKGALIGSGYKVTDDNSTKSFDELPETASTLNISGENTLSPLENESKIRDFDNINVKAGSVTKISGLTAGNTVALIDAQDTDVVVEDGAKLDLAGIEPVDSDAKYLIASNTDDKDNFWNNDALVYDRTESYANAVNAKHKYNITYKQLSALTEKEQQNATNELVDTLGPSAGSIRALAEEVITNGDNINKGAKNFFKDTTSQGQNLSSAMMLIGEAAGVTSNTIAIAGNMADNSVLRLSFTQDDVTGDPRVNENGAVWVKYFHNSRDLDGVDTSLGSFDSDSDFDGVTVGLDIMQYNNMQAGIAFSYGKGDSDGMGIENDFDMWGVNLYGNYKTDYLNFIADIGYSESDNELDGHVLGKKVEADRDVSIITAGLRAETIYTLNNVQFVPYTGIRYYNINPDDYTSKYDGQNAFKYDSDRLNVWTLPLGTSVRGEFAFDNGLKVTPQAEVAYIFAFGDTDDNDVDVSMGTAAASSLKYSVMDDGSFLGNLGLEIGYNSFNFGLGYSYQKGSDAEANNWYVNAEYSF